MALREGVEGAAAGGLHGTPHQKKHRWRSIFLDTYFRENYTFVSCKEQLATHTLDHRENRQNGNEKGSQESREEGREEEVNPTGKRNEGDA